MTGALGFVSAAAQYGLQSIVVKPKRSIGAFTAQVTLEETHQDDLEITEHPVQQGASIADHAFKRPAELTVKCAWSDSPSYSSLVGGVVGAAVSTLEGVQSLITGNSASQVREVYQKLLKLQADRVPFDVYTGKRAYKNMLLRSLSVQTQRETENVLMVTAQLKQVIIVSTQTVTISTPAGTQADPAATAATVDKGSKSLVPAPNYIAP